MLRATAAECTLLALLFFCDSFGAELDKLSLVNSNVENMTAPRDIAALGGITSFY